MVKLLTAARQLPIPQQAAVTALPQSLHVYCDGGVIGSNPSLHGGTWAVVILHPSDENRATTYSGIVTPAEAQLPAITNNVTELLAAVEALERMAGGWAGTLYTDSQVTRFRLTGPDPRMHGVPSHLAARMWAVRERLGKYTVVQLDGHPTRAQLASGIGKRGNRCSKWNVLCDQLCGELAKKFLSELNGAKPPKT